MNNPFLNFIFLMFSLRDDFLPVRMHNITRRGRVEFSRVHWCSSSNHETMSSQVHGRNFICQHSLYHVQVRDTRVTIIVSLTKHIWHHPHFGSPKIVEHKTRLTFADLELLRFTRTYSRRFYILKIFVYRKDSSQPHQTAIHTTLLCFDN